MIVMTLLFLCLSAGGVSSVLADAVGNFTLDVVYDPNPNLTNVKTGDLITYRVTFGCNSTVANCGAMDIRTIFPAELIPVDVQVTVAQGYSGQILYNTPAAGQSTVVVGHTNLLAGRSSEALITVRVSQDANPGPLNGVTFTGNIPGETEPPIEMGDLTIDQQQELWGVAKTKTSPAADPVPDSPVSYAVNLCPATAIGNVTLTNVVITDTLPAGITQADVLGLDGGTFVAGSPNNFITWTIPGPLLPADGCVRRNVTLTYPDPVFNGATVTNRADAVADHRLGTNDGLCDANCPAQSVTHPIVDPDPDADIGKSVSLGTISQNSTGRYFLNFGNPATNVDVTNFVIEDTIPAGVTVTRIESGRWSPAATATVQYSADNGDSWVNVGAGSTNGGTQIVQNIAAGTTVTNVRWTFATMPMQFSTAEAGEIVFTPTVTNPALQNCATISYDDYTTYPTATRTTESSCATTNVISPSTQVVPSKTRINGSGDLQPNQTVQYRLRIDLTERSSADINGLTIVDVLPDELQYVSHTVTYAGGVVAPGGEPIFTNAPDTVAGTPYLQVLTWKWNTILITPPPSGSQRRIDVVVTAQVRPGVEANPSPTPAYENQAFFLTNSPNLSCEAGLTVGSDTDDLDGDGNTTESICFTDARFRVVQAASLAGDKWIRNVGFQTDFNEFEAVNPTDPDFEKVAAVAGTCPDDFAGDEPPAGMAAEASSFTRYPCVTFGYPENTNDAYDDFEYKLIIINDGNVGLRDYILYDILPYVGDTGSGGPQSTVARNSEFQPFITGAVTISSVTSTNVLPGDIVIEYNTSNNPCRAEVGKGTSCDATPWTGSPVGARSFRARIVNSKVLNSLETFTLTVPMRIPADAQSGQISWNSFAQSGVNTISNARIATSEPLKVGIKVPQRMSVGNRVWLDNNNSGTINAGDDYDLVTAGEQPGIPNVRVNLYRDADNNGVPDGPAIAFDITDATGHYLFGNIVPDANANNNRYLIGVDASNFTAGNPLFNLVSTEGVNNADNIDSNDNGIDPAGFTDQVLSAPFTLSLNMITGETDLSLDTGMGVTTGTGPTVDDGLFSRGVRGESDRNSNLSIDFGFLPPYSIGNRVWLDNGAGDENLRNDGLLNGAELGIAGVRVELFFDANYDGSFTGAETTTPIRHDITDGNGYYLFDRLPQGNYQVRIPASNFANGQPLFNLFSSTTGGMNPDFTPDNETDNNDNGIDNPNPAANGIGSVTIRLGEAGDEPTGEQGSGDTSTATGNSPTAGDGAQSRGRFGELDEHSDLTVDFGFYEPRLSIGNRVWYDTDNSGTVNAGDDFDLAAGGDQPGIPGVIVNLYLDANGDGTPDTPAGAPLATDTTDSNGYYLFDNLPVGRYVVAIAPSNFTGGALDEMFNSVTTGANGDAADGGGDANDNGLDAVNATYGVVSVSLNLVPFLEPIAETELSGNAADDTTGFPGTFRGPVKKQDNESDLTVDFGFFKSMSLGNRVWNDDGAGTPGNRDNGVQDAGELGIANVRVELYRDANGDGRPQAGELVGHDVTDATGFYLFDRVLPGTYLVYIPPSNFATGAPLENFDNSNPTGTETTGVNPPGLLDRDDNGIYENYPETNGVVSGPIVMERDNEPTGETDLSADAGTAPGFSPTAGDGPGHMGRYNESDDNSNLTIDFGFVQPLFSIGNRVWADTNNNGLIDPTDDWPEVAGVAPGIPGVRVSLYRDSNNNGVFNLGVDTVVGTDVTDGSGYYLFDNLPAGNYFVWVNQLNFRAISAGNSDDVLFDWYSSTGNATDNQTDNDDNGIDDNTPDVGGVVSPLITLSKNDEPIAEADLSGVSADGPTSRGRFGELDSNSDLTIDFGFYKPLSLGNRVWFDSDGDGVIDFGTENGIAGVRVELYRDTDASGTFTPADVMIGFDTTDVAGYYLFDNLIPGSYFVHLPDDNFGAAAGTDNVAGDPLLGRTSTVDDVGGATDIDSNDNGNDDPNPSANGITSDLITLSISVPPTNEQPINEGDLSSDTVGDGPNRRGRFGETDNNSDLTIDFGFVGSRMSLGNRVWFDGNNNARIDTAGTSDDFVTGGTVAPGIPGVKVRIYRDSNADGVPDSNTPVVPDETTDANGYYLFENLQPGNYVVGLLNTNFAAGQPLNGLISSTSVAPNPLPLDNQMDSDDNGLDVIHPTFGLLSASIQLTLNSEPTGETPSGNAADGPAGDGTGITPENSELTIDFGLYRPMSLGNRLWFDTDADSTHDAGESGVPAGVTVRLYRDDNNDDTPDDLGVPGDPNDDFIATTTTDGNGYYLFDGLGTGRYIVIVDQVNFQPGNPLAGYTSSNGEDTTNNVDRNDNGRNNPTPATGGIRSNVVTLALNTAPTNETDLGPQGHGTHGETNNNSNLTIDFGFITTTQLSLGNLVWLDNGAGGGTGRDGIRNGGETPFAGVRVNLYRDGNADGIPDDLGAVGPAGDIVATDTTDANGHYLFDNLAPGSYIVELAASNFNAGAVLDGYGSTTTLAPDVNNNDNGIDTPNTIKGIRSGTINLAAGAEPSTAAGTPDDDTPASTKGYGAGGVDANGNMTVDFGLYRPMSIGNRVWFDTNADGLISAAENGIAGVTVELRQDANNDGTFDPAVDIVVVATDTTDSLGYYLFGNLMPGNYFVYIRPDQFAAGAPLAGFASTLDNVGAVANDNNDNGVVNGTGIVSNQVALVENSAPTNETDLSGDANSDGPRFIGLNGENNRNSDISIDFGFTATPMSLGNRIWRDTGAGANTNNGLFDGDEAGVPGVRVNLYADTNNDGTPDGGIIRSDVTDANGFYLFDNLPPGSYLVQVAPGNFSAGGALRGLFSSTGVNNDPATDINDNGIDSLNPGANGVFSTTIVLTPGGMPTGEGELSGNAADGPDSRGNNGELDDNSNLTIDFGFSTRFDWGDAPDSYDTTNDATPGPSHVIVGNLFMGSIVDEEGDGQPSTGADGDDTNGAGGDDEDGVTIPTIVAGTNLTVEVVVFNNTGSNANLAGWIDVDGNGVFDAGEGATATVPSSATPQTVTLVFPIPNTADIDTGGQTYARFRLTTGGLTTSDAGGAAIDGEIEDYVVPVNPPGVSVTKSDGLNAIVTGQSTTYTITIQYSGLTGITRIVNDTTSPANAFDPASVSWTCTANGQASCITGQPLDTDIATPVAGLIAGQSVDLQQGGELVYQLTGTLRADYNDAFPGVPNVVNTVALDSGETASDDNGVIFDPPFGVKTGQALNATTIRWTMVWFNTGLPQDATITDVLDASQTNPTNLVCTPFGTTSGPTSVPPAVCELQGGNTVVWSGTMGDGTTPANRTANRLEISFDVTVLGAGTYNNLATITTPGGDPTTATDTVTINEQGEEEDPDGDPSTGTLNPTIAKLVDPPFAQPGDTVTWTILVINPHDQALSNVTVNDTLPNVLALLSATATNGTVTTSGQLVSLNIPTLNAKETVTLTIRTRISPDSQETEIRNVGYLDMPNVGTVQSAEAVVLKVEALPATGQTPRVWIIVRGLVILLALSGVIAGIAFTMVRTLRLR